MERYKKITLLHSNDMHGDFTAETVDEKLTGGVSLLSGYISRVRKEEKNTVYCIAGDMFRGSVIDSDYKGISTIEIMNAISPDVVTLGNHEIDYGLSHLLFLEKCAKFPIINANLYIKSNFTRLFNPYKIIEIDGMKILFIGIITEEVIAPAKKDELIGSFVDIHEAAAEIGRICNAYNSTDIDFTVLLTHIGFEEDKQLAAILDSNWGVDIIIGGHSHTFLEKPEIVNGIPIVQAGTGTDCIGRFDIVVDTQENCIDSYNWQSVEINEHNCVPDPEIEKVLNRYKSETDKKYGRVITRFNRRLTHPDRFRETELGGLLSDILQESLGLDIMLMGSGGIRLKEMGPLVTFADFTRCLPYDDPVYMLTVTGSQLKKMMLYVLRDEVWQGAHTEFYQLSKGLKVVYDRQKKQLLEFSFNGIPITDSRPFKIGLEKYHFVNFEEFLGIPLAEVEANRKITVVSTSEKDVIEEYLTTHQHLDRETDGRLTLI